MTSAQFTREDRDGVVAVVAVGDIDLGNVERFEQVLTEAAAGSPALLIDLTETTYCDSAGIRALFSVAAGTELTLRIRSAGPLRKLLDISGLDRITTVERID